jgi:MFS family permease
MLLVNRNYARLWAGQAVSQLGDFVFDTTLVLWVSTMLLPGRSYAPAAVSAILFCAALATLLVGPIAGVFVDRWDRRRTMLRADLVRAGLVGALTAVAFLPGGLIPVPVTLGSIYAVVLLATAAAQFFNPSRFALIGDVVAGDADRARATGIGQATMALAGIIGPPLAAPLLFTVGLRWALLVNALSFLASYLAVRSVRIDPPVDRPERTAESGRLRRELLDGLRVIGGSRFLRGIIIPALVVNLGAGALNALGVFFVTENLHVEARFFGTLDLGFGIGSVVGALAAGFLAARLGNVRVLWLGWLLTGLALVVYARLGSLPAAIVVLGFVSLPLAAGETAAAPLLLRAAPREYVGRVMSVLTPSTQLAQILSIVAAGWLASTVLLGFHASLGGVELGRIDTIFTAGALLIAAGAIYTGLAPSTRGWRSGAWRGIRSGNCATAGSRTAAWGRTASGPPAMRASLPQCPVAPVEPPEPQPLPPLPIDAEPDLRPLRLPAACQPA